MNALQLKNDVLQLIIDIDDTSKLEQVKKFLQSNIVEPPKEDYQGQTKQDILEGLELAVQQANMVKEGTLKAKPIQALLDGL